MRFAADGTAGPSPSASAAPASSAGDADGSYQAVTDQKETQSGHALVAEAYGVIWLAFMVFIGLAWRRTRALEQKVEGLEQALAKASRAAAKGASAPSGATEPSRQD